MAYDAQHVLITWGGILPGNETWSCGLRVCQGVHVTGTSGTLSQEFVREWLNGSMKDAVRSYHTDQSTLIAPICKLSFVKAARIGTDGRYLDDSTDEYVFPDVSGAGASSVLHPQQVALAISLTTGYTRGPAHRGRFFLPMPAVGIGNDGLITETNAELVRGTTKTFIEAIADVPGVDLPTSLTPTVMSRRGDGAHRKITGVEVGRVLDTQRRRRRGLKENYKAVTLDLGSA